LSAEASKISSSTMFWKYNTMSTSQMETLMDKEDVSLIDVLEEEDVIQECKIQNKKLIEL
jgi:hypothetical protein